MTQENLAMVFHRPTFVTPRPSFARVACLASLFAAGLAGSSGCGKVDKSQVKVAEVEDHVITLDYFERKMNTMDPEFLPENINSREGRLDLLEIMINKEVMEIKAEELGLAQDGQVDYAAKQITDFAAVATMRREVRQKALDYTEDEVYDYYENLARALKVSYMVFDWESDAVEAKRLVEGGEDWYKVAKRLSVMDSGDNYMTTMRYGTVADNLEKAVFDLQVGEICDPVDTPYGYFIVRLDGQQIERVQPLEQMREKIVESIRKQKDNLLTAQFVQEVFDEYDFHLNEDAVRIVFDALPPDASLDPPTPKEELKPLNLEPSVMDMELMRYADQVWTIRRYNDFYNGMSVFARPRRERRVAQLRRSLQETAIRELMPVVAKDRGYMDRPEIRDEYKERREKGLVTRLHKEMVLDQIRITPEDLEVYWEHNKQKFFRPETRTVLALVAANEERAQEAYQKALDPDVDWDQLIQEYCTPGEVKDRKGHMGDFTRDNYANSTTGRIAWEELENEGDVLPPRKVLEGQWLIVKIAKHTMDYQPTLDEVRVEVGRTAKAEREEELFQQRVEEWKSDMFIRRYPEALDKAVYDPSARPVTNTEIGLTEAIVQ
jgi:parvulin-like peptidyl-prolyl isomerase